MNCSRIVFTCLVIGHSCMAQSWQDTLSLIDKKFSQYKPENPGCQVSVSRNGQIIFSKAWGMADLERHVPLSTSSILEGGSVSKQFTAAAILLLEQQGKLSLEDDVRKYIPELPDYGTPIILRQMLHHTSGLRDWGAIAELAGWPRGKKFYSNEDALEIIARQQQLNNVPGAEFLYSNSNYNLFAIIVQRVSGLTLAAFTHQYIFGPAGMKNTSWRNDPNRLVSNRAIAYSKSDSAYHTDMPNEYVYGNGGLLTTTEDLLKWNDFYQQEKLGTPSLLSKQTKTDPLNNGVMNNYAAGLFMGKVMGWYTINHSGATAGYRAYLETFPELHLSIAVLSNTSEFNIIGTANMIREVFVPGKPVQNIGREKNVPLTDAQLQAVIGLYKNERNGSTFQLSIKDQYIILDNYLLLQTTAPDTFKADNFLFQIKGGKGWYIPFTPSDTIRITKMPSVALSNDTNIYTGKYYSDETSSYITIKEGEGKLTMLMKPGDPYPLQPTYKDAFKLEALDADIEFTRSAAGIISEMHVNVARARNVIFKKMK